MLFNSYQFIVFFAMTTAAVYAISPRLRWAVLLLASCYFYMVFVPKYILILFAVILIDYVAALMIEPAKGVKRRSLLAASLCANVGILAYYKYANFAQSEVLGIFSWFGISIQASPLDILLPIGLSFHTFQSMSYTIEVYRGAQKAERHLGIYALYVLFYPQMVAGPIERPQNILPQLHAPPAFCSKNLIDGLQLMIWGLFKKMVIADNLALIVNPAYNNPEAHHGWPLVIATYAFAIQIFCDFSGYSDIARGAAQTMGYKLMVNFNIPYHSKSIAEFWGRWHISLSTWFRDYMYIPLGGNRHGKWRQYCNIFAVFLVSGLWHGPSWAFVAWGAIHGSYLVVGDATYRFRQKLWERIGMGNKGWLRSAVAVLITFHLVVISWVPFRAGTLVETRRVFSQMFSFSSLRDSPVTPFLPLDDFARVGLVISLILMAVAHLLHRRYGLRNIIMKIPRPLHAGLVVGAILLIFLWGRFDSKDFIYFQF